MTMNTPFLLFFRQIATLTTLLAVILSMAVGCSSDDDGDAVEISGTVPNLLNYAITQDTGTFMTLTQNPSATLSSASLIGTFNRTTEEFTLSAQQPAVMAVSAADFLTALDTALGGGVSFSNYQLHVITAATWTGDNDPTSGEFDIVSADQLHRINVKVNNTLPGVDITYLPNGTQTDFVSLTWEQFDAVFDNPGTDPYAGIASFANSMLRFVYEQGELVIFALEFLGENDVILETSGTIVEDCDTFPVLQPPLPTVSNPGTSMVSWTDVDNDNSISSGDTLYLDFVECWDDDETDDFDTLFDRGITFSNYIENQVGDVITRVGFAGIDFTGLSITETEATPTNIVIVNAETITLTGGFSMVFTSP